MLQIIEGLAVYSSFFRKTSSLIRLGCVIAFGRYPSLLRLQGKKGSGKGLVGIDFLGYIQLVINDFDGL